MKNIKFLILPLFAVAFFTNCEKIENSAELSATTFLPRITVEGERSVTLPCGNGSYADPGASAEEAGQTIDLTTTINGKYFGLTEVSEPDEYTITYSAENKDGIPGVETRSILVPVCNGDLITDISGMYTAYLTRSRSDGSSLATPQYQGVGPIFIKSLGGGQYAISDAIGGWYEYGRSLGVAYAALGQTVTANDIATNDFTYGPPIEVSSFGGALEMTEFSVDAANKEINFRTEWEFDFQFDVRLVQND